jgi:uncharacterized protein
MKSIGFAAMKNARRYVQQLVKHWGHKFETTYVDGVGSVPFNEHAIARFYCEEASVRIELQSPSADIDAKLRETIERHLDRFAFREAPLVYQWEQME